LLMPDQLDGGWWSPLMPLWFLLSAIAAGIALVILIEMWIARAWRRPLRMPQLAALGKLAFWALLVFEVVRIGELVLRGQLMTALSRPKAPLLVAEIVFGGILSLVMLSTEKLRQNPKVLFWGALFACGGVILNRADVVIFAMYLKGPMPLYVGQPYLPSVFEWGVSVGLVAATIFLFGWAARNMPLLPKEEPSPRADVH